MSRDPNLRTEPLEVPIGAKYALVWSRFNQSIVAKLVEGAKEVFSVHGVGEEALYLAEVPGAWELGHAAQKLAQSGRFDAVIALGAIVRGGTPHFDYVAKGTVDQLARVTLDTGVPVVLGVLTTDSEAQAFDRAGGRHGNKGGEAAMTAIEMVALDRTLAADGITKKGS
jgi:6,7-dimethyl-8-ribityllumazine synthase